VPRQQPVKQRRAGVADVQGAGGAGSETSDDGHGESPLPKGRKKIHADQNQHRRKQALELERQSWKIA